MPRAFVQGGIRIALIMGVVALLMYAFGVRGNTGVTFATGGGTGTPGLELKIDSEATYNGVPQPALSWSLKDLVPGVDKFWNFDDIKPGDWGENTISLHIEKSPAYMCLNFENVIDLENGMNEPEALVDVDPFSGELAEGMEFFAWHDDGDNLFEVGEKPLFGTSTQSATLVLASTTYTLADASSPAPYQPGVTYYFAVQWCAGDMVVNLDTAVITCDPTTIGNEAQTDSMSVDVSITAVRASDRPGYKCDGSEVGGCTPGYWKQSQHFGNWKAPYTPNTLFSSVFENAFPGKTLLQVLSLQGGGLDALGRHTVAALLNAANANVGYAYGTSTVISKFNAIYPGGNYETLKNEFAKLNETYCPLGRSEGGDVSGGKKDTETSWYTVEKKKGYVANVISAGKNLMKKFAS